LASNWLDALAIPLAFLGHPYGLGEVDTVSSLPPRRSWKVLVEEENQILDIGVPPALLAGQRWQSRWPGRGSGQRLRGGFKELWSPEQIARRLRLEYPSDPMMWVSHETIYQSLFLQRLEP